MLEQWILDQIDPLRPAPLVILRDPQRIIQKGAWVVDGWAEEHGYTVFFCVGNLGLREMVENVRGDKSTHLLLVDRSRQNAKTPLFYPDLDAEAKPNHKLSLSLREFLIHQTGDPRWPHLVEDRNLSRLILENLEDALRTHQQLRQVDPTRFTDTDLRKIVIGATLKINPFREPSPSEIRRLCVAQHRALEKLDAVLPEDVMDTLRHTISRAPAPFCYLLERDPGHVMRAFTLAALMHQHKLDYTLLISNIDPSLHEYRDIDASFLEEAMKDLLAADPDSVAEDIRATETFLEEDPGRLEFLLHEQLELDDADQARTVLMQERLSPMVRSLALMSLLADLILDPGKVRAHEGTLRSLQRQVHQSEWPAMRRPTDIWQALVDTYARAIDVFKLLRPIKKYAKQFTVASSDELTFKTFEQLWNEERLNRLDFYISDLERTLRVGNVSPIPQSAYWPDLASKWTRARNELASIVRTIEDVQLLIDRRFQDLYHDHYAEWMRRADTPMVFTHQFLDRVLKSHWDPTEGRKAVVLVFDGLRVDAWEELLRPVFEERFEIVASYPGSALIPTETHLSRKAIAAGCLPESFSSQNEVSLLTAWLKRWIASRAPSLEVVKDQDTDASGMTVWYRSDPLDYVIFNFTDANLHHNSQDLAFIYTTTVREIIRQDVRSLLRELPDDALVFIVSDHGFVPMPEKTVTVPDSLVSDSSDVTYRHARTSGQLESDNVIAFDARRMGIPAVSGVVSYDTVLFPRPGHILRRQRRHSPPDRYSHGGVSLAECLVPMVVLGPRTTEAPLLTIDDLRQVGSLSEGDPLTLEIEVATSGISLPDLMLTLDFSRDGIPKRREVFSGQQAVYEVTWTPILPEITEEDRRAGAVHLPLTVVLSYRDKGQLHRTSASVELIVKLVPGKLRRRVDSKLDFLMGKVPKGLQS